MLITKWPFISCPLRISLDMYGQADVSQTSWRSHFFLTVQCGRGHMLKTVNLVTYFVQQSSRGEWWPNSSLCSPACPEKSPCSDLGIQESKYTQNSQIVQGAGETASQIPTFQKKLKTNWGEMLQYSTTLDQGWSTGEDMSSSGEGYLLWKEDIRGNLWSISHAAQNKVHLSTSLLRSEDPHRR